MLSVSSTRLNPPVGNLNLLQRSIVSLIHGLNIPVHNLILHQGFLRLARDMISLIHEAEPAR